MAVVSAGAFGMSGTMATSLLHAGWTPAAAVAARLAVGSVALAVPALRALRGRWRDLGRGTTTVVTYGLLAVAAAQLCYFEAVQHLSVAVALLLEYSGTVLVVGWMWARHRQVPSRTAAAGSVVALVGLGAVLDLLGSHHLDPVGVLWGLGAAVGLAAYFVVSAADDQPLAPVVVAWGGLTVGAASMVAVAAVGVVPWRSPATTVTLAHTRVSWVVPVLAIGLVAGAFAYVSGIAAARVLGARLASFVGLAEVLFAAGYARVLLGQRLGATQLAGGALVLAGIALVRLGEPAASEPAELGPAQPEPAELEPAGIGGVGPVPGPEMGPAAFAGVAGALPPADAPAA